MSRQVFPDTYSTPVKIDTKKPNTNPRYKNFNQTHFTAGDEEQFEQNRIKKHVTPIQNFQLDFSNPIDIWENLEINTDTIRDTFNYIFKKFKKGIFVQIRGNKVVNFLPFSNNFFVNEWSDRILVPDHMKNTKNILHVSQWYSNNGLFRYESPINETDTGMCQMKNMFETLCNQYPQDIPDIDFFVNRRDFPILKKDFTEPYNNIYDSSEFPLVSHKYEKYIPILSSCTFNNFADIPIPTMDDWTRVCFQKNIHFAMTKRVISTNDKFNTPWDKKKPRVVFRGSNTGIGHTIENNPRLKLCHLFQKHPLFNVGITSWSDRPRKLEGEPFLHFPKKYDYLSAAPITLEEQSTYKYIVHIEGHVQAFRLSIEMAMGSVILLVHSDYKLWFQDKMIPWVHYIPVNSDLSDLLERVQWCVDNDNEAKKIAKNSRQFYDDYLSMKGCLSYLKNVIHHLASHCIRLPYEKRIISPRTIQIHHIRKKLDSINPKRILVKLKPYKLMASDLINLCTSGMYETKQTIFQNNNSTIIMYDKKYVHKTSKHYQKLDHELYSGIFCVNKILLHIPNFVYTIPYYKGRGLYLEYVEGNTFFEYIKSPQFTMNTWYKIMVQVLLSISVAQRICFFMHNDLCPWNIILHKKKEYQAIDYFIDMDQIYRLETDLIPVIIDYDKCSIISDMQKFEANVKTTCTTYNSYQDSLCLLVSSIYNILRYQRLSPEDEAKMLHIFKSCLIDDKYCNFEQIYSFQDMKNFLDEAHKYSHITFSDKGSLSKKCPKDMFDVFLTLIKQDKTFNIQKVDTYIYRNIHKTYPSYPTNVMNTKNIHPLLKLYIEEIYDIRNGDRKVDSHHNIQDIQLPKMTDTNWDQGKLVVYPTNYMDYINILMELCHSKKLFKDEKIQLNECLKPFLQNKNNIYTYSDYLINFKLSQNIF